MKIRDIMSRRVRWATPEDSLPRAEQIMIAGGFHHLPVVSDGDIVGLLSQRDLLRHRATIPLHIHQDHTVEHVMNRDIETIGLDVDVDVAAQRMAAAKIGSLIVVDDGGLAGIVTTTDMLNAHRLHALKARHGVAQTRAADVMRRECPTVSRDDDLITAARKMYKARLTAIPVVDEENGRVLGLLSERELRLTIQDPFDAVETRLASLGDFTAEMAMTPAPMVTADAPLSRVLFQLSGEWAETVLVVDQDDALLGTLAFLDLLDHLVE